MLSNELKAKINKLWDKFWSRGITNPITAIEQISYLLFMRRIDDADALEKAKATFAEQEYKTIFQGNEDCRWSHFSQPSISPDEKLDIVAKQAFPFIKKTSTIHRNPIPGTCRMRCLSSTALLC